MQCPSYLPAPIVFAAAFRGRLIELGISDVQAAPARILAFFSALARVRTPGRVHQPQVSTFDGTLTFAKIDRSKFPSSQSCACLQNRQPVQPTHQ